MGPFARASIPQSDEALRPELQAFLAQKMPSMSTAARARSWLGFDADFSRELAKAGWLGLALPKEYGGAERSAFARFVVAEELLAAGAPVSAHWIADRQSGPLILKYGTDSQKKFHLPRICAGKSFFCIGMSEPEAGSDLASVRTRAERTARGWRLSGQKLWTTNAHRSHYIIVLARTSSAAGDRHKGLSQLIVDLSLPGIAIRPIEDLAGDRGFSEVFFDGVELGDDALIGVEGAGWAQVTAELALERSGPERLYSSLVVADAWLAGLRHSGAASPQEIQLAGALATRLAALRAMSLSVTQQLTEGASPAAEAALVKDLGTEFEQWVPAAIAGALGASPGRATDQNLESALAYAVGIAPSFSLRGGTREILRGMIAKDLGLG